MSNQFGPDYYAGHASALGWDASHTPDKVKLQVLRDSVVGDTILDLACGPGVYAAALADGKRRIIGMDFSRALLRSGSELTGWLPVAASGLAVPLRESSVDTTCVLSVLEHVDDAAMMREVARVTRRRLIVQVPLREPRLMAEAGVLFSHWSDRSHLRTYTEDQLRDLFAGAGWRMTSFIPAYRRDLQELYVRGLAVPEVVRNTVRALLKPFKHLGAQPAAEAFAIAEPR